MEGVYLPRTTRYIFISITTNTPLQRQIRNAFQTAIALAEFRATEALAVLDPPPQPKPKLRIELSKKHFVTVAQASKDFDDYLQRTLGGQNEADLARNEQTRIDDFNTPKGYVLRKKEEVAVGKRGKKGKGKVVDEDSEESESEGDSEESEGEEGEESGSESEEEVVVRKKKGRR